MKIAIVHDWLVTYAGAEKVLEQMLNCFPEADLFSLVDFLPEGQRHFIQNKPVATTFIQNLPLARTHFRKYLPLMPRAIERLDLSGYDVVLSSSHSIAKGVVTRKDQPHICYIHTPMRYAWFFRNQYLQEYNYGRGMKRFFLDAVLNRLRTWDKNNSGRVNSFIANSDFVAERVRQCYGRDAETIYPPVDTGSFELVEKKEDFYLAAGRMVPYKKTRLIVETFANFPDKKLVVIGDGPEYELVRKIATRNVNVMGYQPFEVLRDHMQRANAFIFAAEEDFGITPVEAQACGTPVIAFGKGGALETISGGQVSSPTGVFFGEQTEASLRQAIEDFESLSISPYDCQQNAIQFSIQNFRESFTQHVNTILNQFNFN
ncbi:MAG: glycosyl transferase family 1 [Desulfuromonas sp.]|nr:MAG: glycosyl transferase family 1 [Desulfuromonas sp.]